MQDKIPKSNEQLQIKIISDSGNTYICKSSIGTSLTEDKWSITKVDSVGNVTYPVSSIASKPVYSFMFNTNDVLTYTYSYN